MRTRRRAWERPAAAFRPTQLWQGHEREGRHGDQRQDDQQDLRTRVGRHRGMIAASPFEAGGRRPPGSVLDQRCTRRVLMSNVADQLFADQPVTVPQFPAFHAGFALPAALRQ